MDKPVAAAPTGAKEKVEKQARQLAYDVRYKTKQSMAQKSGGRLDPAQVQKAYMSQLAKSPAPPAVKSRAKQMLMGEDYKKDIGKLVSDSAATALYKVFVEHHQKDANGNVIEHDGNPRPEEEIADDLASNSVEDINEEEKQYKVRVTDKKTSNSYVRMATRAKIGELRSNPNIASVEMTEYGSPTRSEKYKGKQTAKVKQGLDPVGKEDSDVNNDGKVNSSDKYLMKRRKAIGKAMAKEEYSWRDGFAELIEKKEKEKKITGEGVDNSKLIKVFPDEVKEQMMDKEEKPQMAKPDPQLVSKEKKQAMLKKQVLMKKLQAVRAGAGSDITSSYEPEGENVEEAKYGASEVRYLDKDAEKRAQQRDAARTENRIAARERAAAKRRKDRNQLRKQGQYGAQGKYYVTKHMEKESVEMKPKDKTPENAGDITFDAGGAIPATIKAIGDPRELETAMKLKKTQLRASGLNMSHEPKGDTISDAYVVNQADKTSNTPAYQGFKAGKKNQITGEPLYKKGNMKENLVTIEKFNNVANINVKPSNYNSEKDLIKDILNKKADVAYENRQVAYEPEKHPDPDESDKPYHKRSRAARMRDPKRGINSPAFKKFMADRGM